MSKRPPSRLARLASLGGLTGRVSSSYLGEKVKDVFRSEEAREKAMARLHLDNAEKIVDTLGRLKGAAMKVGQSMAMAASSLDLGEDVTRVLGKLHAEAVPVPFEEIREQVEAQLEKPLAEAFAWFDETPLGTASLGQAHAARLPDGTEVVVKVLHRGVETSVETDLMALKAIFVGSRVLRREKAEVDSAFDEIQARLEEELDYLQEAANIDAFVQIYGSDPRVRIPRVHPKWSTERVLTMDRLPGEPLDAFLAHASPEARQRAGLTLAELYYEMAFRHRMLHADPHPGNYLFEADGRVGLLDFGCVKRFDEFWIANYARAGMAGLDGDRATCLDHCRRIDALHGDDPAAEEQLWRFIEVLSGPYRAGPYTIGDHEVSMLDRLRPVVKDFVKNPDITLPRDVIFLHRSLGGLYSIARRLVVRADWGELVHRHMGYAVQRAEGRIPA